MLREAQGDTHDIASILATAEHREARCSVKGAQCQPATEDVPSDLNPHGTSFVKLPRQCQGRVHQIVILDADSDDPKVDVTCAPIEEPIQEMK